MVMIMGLVVKCESVGKVCMLVIVLLWWSLVLFVM